ncbi:DUF4230 domain-containing protein [Fulvivirgaceae bacterium BMA10]|uniref:DUF4230 domain-containing protein n=1 Tax=Splendidivirga corallicola TaxID=3051826 RepID=A0ABT8KNQ9_9BACT|nr:DUF4230 domain-containing protein [Fulvivirgaceae bacterium BMA10]
MFLSKLTSSVSFLFQAIVVVAGVLVFSYFDPFNLLAPSKLTLKDTPVSVKSIKEIGQLITAEYYGEVVSSLKESIKDRQDTNLNVFKRDVFDLNEDFIGAISDLHEDLKDGEIKRRHIYKHFTEDYPDIRQNSLYDQYLNFIFRRIKGRNFKENHFNDRLSERKEENLVTDLVRDTAKIVSYRDTTNFQSLFSIFNAIQQKKDKKEFKRSQLVLLGRGWVKAGFDFGTFDENNFRYDADRQRIYFIGLKPQILSADINPWFIPEKGVEGFEFLVVRRRAQRDYKVLQEVKQACLDKLIRQAYERDIFLKATENARENLINFFSLIMDDEIDNVIFYDNIFDYTLDIIGEDSVINGEELIMIDRVMSLDKDPNDHIEDLAPKKILFMDSIRQYPVQMLDTVLFDINPFLSMAYRIGQDETFGDNDVVILNQYKLKYLCSGKFDTVWYGEEVDSDSIKDLKQSDFEQSFRLFESKIDEVLSDTTSILKSDSANFYNHLEPHSILDSADCNRLKEELENALVQ